MTRGVISIGTNSTRALVADLGAEQPRILLRRSIGTRIGEGLKESGTLESEPMRRTLCIVKEHAEAVRGFTSHYRVIATSALRRASNRDAFAKLVSGITHKQLETIPAEEEAQCSYAGAVLALHTQEERFGVIDLGGGSTEYATGNRRDADRFVSCEIGAVRLTEALPELSGARGDVPQAAVAQAHAVSERALQPVRLFRPVEKLLAVGGTATTIIALLRENREPFDYATLHAQSLHELIERLRALPLSKRRALAGIEPQRADIILAGAIILAQAFRIAGHVQADVSTHDLLLGFLLRHAGKRAS